MAVDRLKFAFFLGLVFLGCSLGESELEKAAKEFRTLHGSNWGIADISPADRFGENVIAVDCVSEEDRAKFRVSLPNSFKGFRVVLTAPMWGIGGLVSDSEDTKNFLKWSYTPPHNVHGTEANKELLKLRDKVAAADSAVWASWNEEQRRKFISDWIKKERKERFAGYANCGDKFLLPD